MVDHLTRAKRSWNMSRIRSGNTKPEKVVRSLLHAMGYRFRLHRKNLPGKPDIVLPKYKTVIFVHGCFWHRHPGCKNATMPKTNTEFWEDKLSQNIDRDRKKQSLIPRHSRGLDVVNRSKRLKTLSYLKVASILQTFLVDRAFYLRLPVF
jgi:DNA mismatch endonuclease (patch repair protein)